MNEMTGPSASTIRLTKAPHSFKSHTKPISVSRERLHGNAQDKVVDLHAAGIANTDGSIADVSKVDWS